MPYINLEYEKNNILQEIKRNHYVTSMAKAERVIKIPISTIREWMRKDSSFQNQIEEVMLKNKLILKARHKQQIEEMLQRKENRKDHELER